MGRNCRNRVYFNFAMDAICCEKTHLKVRCSSDFPDFVKMYTGGEDRR